MTRTDAAGAAAPGRLTLSDDEEGEIAAVAAALADAAGAAILPLFRTPAMEAENKSAAGFDPVTAADRAAEMAIRALLAERRPADAIRGEEFGAAAGSSGLTWVIDPIDGTRAFLAGAPTWGVLVAACDAAGPRFGIIDQPHTGERWTGGFGRADLATPHGVTPLATRPPRPLSGAILMTTFPEIGTDAEHAAFTRVSRAVRLVRYGMDCYAYGLVAAGQIDLVIEAGLQDYDVCAPIAVIEAAGGIVTDWQGRPAHGGGQILAAANAQVHAAALALLNG
jgi:histidinol phosphatase-like enzyme (inositol monophosphatase family)